MRCVRAEAPEDLQHAAEYLVLALCIVCWQESSTSTILRQFQHKARSSMVTLAAQAAQAGAANALSLLLRFEEYLESACDAEGSGGPGAKGAGGHDTHGTPPASLAWTSAGKPAEYFPRS